MRVLSKVLWIIAFVAATFCWMVLFEHGFTAEGFSKGLKEAIGDLISIAGNNSQADQQLPPAPSSQPEKTK